jgi:hypothetical protein
MTVNGSDVDIIPVQPLSSSIDVERAPVREPDNSVADQVSLSDFTRVALLTPPRDGAHLAELRQMVYTGEYGPPAATIAEALITRAMSLGVAI